MFWISLCMLFAMFAIAELLDKTIDAITLKSAEETTKEDRKIVFAACIARISVIAMIIVHSFNLYEDWRLIFTGVVMLLMNLYYLHIAKTEGKSTVRLAVATVFSALLIFWPIVDIFM